MPRRSVSRIRVLGIALVGGLLAACGASPSPSVPISPESSVSASASSLPAPASTTPVAVTPEPTPEPTPADLAHRPFTVLVLGLDFEGRSDSISLVGVDPVAKTVRIASIPRDTIDVPLPGGGTLRGKKINAFYNIARSDPSRYPAGPERAVADLVANMLDVRVDYYASTTFGGFERLVDAIGGVTITLPSAIVDSHYEVTTTQVGVRFPKGTQKLNGQRALIFVRTRYSDNDFERQRRQHFFLAAVAKQLAAHPAQLAPLLVSAATNVRTDVPTETLPAFLSAAGSADEWTYTDTVLGPSKYESAGTCTCGYALVPKLDEMRKLAASFFPWAVES